MKRAVRISLLIIAIIVTALIISYLLSGGKTEIFSHVRIQKSPEVVFDFISDMRNELKWNPDVKFMEKITNGDIGIGTTFKAKWRLSDTIDVTLTKYERPHKVTFENGGKIDVTLNLKLIPIDSNTTELESRFIATPHGFTRAIFPIIKSKLELQEKENMINLKKALEHS